MLVEHAINAGEGKLASNGAIVCLTGDRGGRSPNDKYLEDTPAVHDKIWWGKVNRAITPAAFDIAAKIAVDHLNSRPKTFTFEGFAGADPKHRLGVRVVTEQAWHALFASTLFIRQGTKAAGGSTAWKHDWTVINAGRRPLTADEAKQLGVTGPVLIAQSLEKKTVIILGTEYAGDMKKSIFYALNFDLPEVGIFPMHCSCNVSKGDHSNAAVFFGLSGTGKTTLSADPNRALIGDDEHGWSDQGVGVVLSQNVPNPFTNDTRISYSISQPFKSAKLGVYDLNGQELKLVPLTAISGDVIIQSGNLKAGMYVYALIIDGKSVATKRMILTSK